ncbi:MAG: PAS domain S-box protein [Syntrophomonadaceae bacterium]|nr:PAS domain S-box protein [Syntrophomonadaceae bacterium]
MSVDHKQNHNQHHPASITEETETMKHLQMFKEVVDNSTNPFAAGYQDGHISYWNRAFEELTGYSSRELKEINWIDALVPAYLRGQEATLFTLLSQNQSATSFEQKLRRKDGTLVPIKYTVCQAHSSNADCPLYYGFVTDISREISLQEALRFVSQGVMVLEERAIIWVNQAFSDLTGYSFDEVVGADYRGFNLINLSDNQIVEMNKGVDRKGKWRGNIIACRRNGITFPCQLSITSIRNENEPSYRFIILFSDISEQIKLRQEQNRLQKQTAAIQRLTSLSAMSAGIVHEIAQPLNSIKVLVDGMLYYYDRNYQIPSSEVFEKLEEISVELHRINEIIRHMRSFAKINANPRLEPCNLNDSIIRTLKLLGRQLAAHDIKVSTNLHPDLPQIYANPNRLDEIIINLLANAIQELDKVGYKHREISCSTWQDKNFVILEVSDNAAGIEESVLDSIFEPFITTKSVRQGMGLGLSVVHTIVTRLGGQISACNRDGSGATFTVKFPVLESIREGGL